MKRFLLLGLLGLLWVGCSESLTYEQRLTRILKSDECQDKLTVCTATLIAMEYEQEGALNNLRGRSIPRLYYAYIGQALEKYPKLSDSQLIDMGIACMAALVVGWDTDSLQDVLYESVKRDVER